MKGKILVTAALPYVNNVPHLGTLVCILSADVYTRYLRLQKKNVLFICGTDEHGTTAETKAAEMNMTPRQLVDHFFTIHKKAYEWFNCRFDCFGRTSSKENHEIASDIFVKLHKNGYLLEKEVTQLFCSHCNKFLSDRFVEGTCPKCNYEEARGDQCEHCGSLLNPEDLINPICKNCHNTPEERTSKHLFIDLPKLNEKLLTFINSREQFWSTNAKQQTQAWLKTGLKPRCITRDLKWGVPVPVQGYEEKVMYSWFDAPIGYISIVAECKDDWKSWWQSDAELVQFMGKDNIPFHTILFPSFLIGSGDPWTLVKKLSVNEYLNYESGKFSKSRGEGVFADDAMSSGIPADIWRYYIIKNRPESADTIFKWDDFQEKNNNELLANLGNFVNRTLVFLQKHADNTICSAELHDVDRNLIDAVTKTVREITERYERIELKEALQKTMHVARLGNQYFQEQQPWKLAKDAKKRCQTVLAVCASLVAKLAILVSPFLPETSEKIYEQLNTTPLQWSDTEKDLVLETGHVLNNPKVLFKKIEDDDVEVFRNKFKGKKQSINKLPLNLKVGRVTDIQIHPKADKLYILQVDLGAEARQIVTGLRDHLAEKDLLHKHIIVVTNLKPAKLRGVESNGMLLAAELGGKLVVVQAPTSTQGAQVTCEGYEQAESINQDQITIQEFAEVKMEVQQKKVLLNGKTLHTSTERLQADIDDGAIVR